MRDPKNILICPLDWGIGHATRCVPIIKSLIELKQHVIVGAAKRPLAFLKSEFPDLKFIEFPGYDVNYPKKGSMSLHMALSAPRLFQKISREHKFLIKVCEENNIDAIISDNRYGLWHPDLPSVFMTHQINIQTNRSLSFLKPVLKRINKRFIKKFTECWIPDFPGEKNLAGKLCHGKSITDNSYYIGPLSRFHNTKHTGDPDDKYDVVVLISGPEPQRSIFERKIISQCESTDKSVLILSGKPDESTKTTLNITTSILSHLDSESLFRVIKDAGLIVSRSGYSTIMDLACLNKKAVFVPTPGQTEQEYLAEYHSELNHSVVIPQSEFELQKVINECYRSKGLNYEFSDDLLQARLNCLLDSLYS